jgi:hypothetical protein
VELYKKGLRKKMKDGREKDIGKAVDYYPNRATLPNLETYLEGAHEVFCLWHGVSRGDAAGLYKSGKIKKLLLVAPEKNLEKAYNSCIKRSFIGNDGESWADKVFKTIPDIKAANIDLRALYDTPTFLMTISDPYNTDGHIQVEEFDLAVKSQERPSFVINKLQEPYMFEVALRYFNSLWDKGRIRDWKQLGEPSYDAVKKEAIQEGESTTDKSASQAVPESAPPSEQSSTNHKFPEEIIIGDQKEHLAAVETYLERLRGHFPEVTATWGVHLSDIKGENQLRSHLKKDVVFWQNVDMYEENRKRAHSLYKQLYNEIESKVSRIAPRDPFREIHTTGSFTQTVIAACADEFLLPPKYEWIEATHAQLFGNMVISVGIESEKEHRNLVDYYKAEGGCSKLKSLCKILNDSRVPILEAIERALQVRAFRYDYCDECPLVISGYKTL